MLSAIFESADLSNKMDASIASGDWSQWTAGEFDQWIKDSDGEVVDQTIGRIVKSQKEFPDGFYEALVRKHTAEEISGSIEHYIVDEENGRINFHQSYYDHMDPRSQKRIQQELSNIARGHSTRFVTNPDAPITGGRHQYLPWDTSEVEKAKAFMNAYWAEKRKAAAKKAVATKAQAKADATKDDYQGLKKTMTEHWHRWMPDQVPEQDTAWEKLRPLLKTKSKMDIDMMLREMEKVGVVSSNEHGSKVFRAAKYQEVMNGPRDKFAHSHIKDYDGKWANAQMIRGTTANSMLVSVGLPLSVENRWKKEHPKLYDFLQKLRKESSHKPVYKGSRPVGWVRIDKLTPDNWLIEELQQDVDAIGDDAVGMRVYRAENHKQNIAEAERQIRQNQEILDNLEQTKKLLEQWVEVAEQWMPQWDRWEMDKKKKLEHCFQWNGDIDPHVKQDAPGIDQWKGLLKETLASNHSARIFFDISKMFRPREIREDILANGGEIYVVARETKNAILEAKTRISESQDALNSGKEDPNHTEWQKDKAAMQEVVDQFPRWAMHAVKLAAKEHGVKNLWWVTYDQKKELGGANPPRSFTSDALGRKFGFKKVEVKTDCNYSDPCYEIAGTRIMHKITSMSDPKQHYLWMAPVSDIVTESAKQLDISVFG